MKKRIAKLTALMFAAALLALPGKAFSFRQMLPGVSTYSITASNSFGSPIPDDLAASDKN